jgi:hypothetical protein
LSAPCTAITDEFSTSLPRSSPRPAAPSRPGSWEAVLEQGGLENKR